MKIFNRTQTIHLRRYFKPFNIYCQKQSGDVQRRLIMNERISSGSAPAALTPDPVPSLVQPFKVNPTILKEWDELQKDLRNEIITYDTETWQSNDNLKGLNRVAGVDVSISAKDCNAHECDAFAAVVICKFPTMEVIHQETEKVRLNVPYVSGYLAFREASAVINLLKRITANHPDKIPDVLLVDGNGVLHPHRCGLACHVGVQTTIPTIGVAKNLHLLEDVGITKKMVQGMEALGDSILIKDNHNEAIGMALKTASDTKNPMYVSIGHKISLDTAKRVVLKCCKYRVPEPIRFADNISRELIRQNEKESESAEEQTLNKL